MSEHNWISICKTTDIPQGVGVCAQMPKGSVVEQVAIFKVPNEDGFVAVDNYCPFAEANVISRGIIGDLKGHLVVASPIYKQHFDLRSGQCLEDESVKLQTLSVRDNAGKIEVGFS